MANPRQRRKQRSNHKAVRHSNHAKKNLKKMPPLRAPKALREAWDSKLTVKQNYARLGLLATLNPRAKGGSELVSLAAKMNAEGAANSPDLKQNQSTNDIPRGYGRIIRDSHGNVVDVEMGEEQDVEPTVNANEEDEDRVPIEDEEMEKWLGKRPANAESTEFIQGLESLSANVSKVPRTASGGERAWLRDVITKYGDDIDAAARDRKLNPWQRTAGQIRRSIAKAGGMDKLRA